MDEIPKPEIPPALRVGVTYNLKKHVTSDIPDFEAEYDDFETIVAIKAALERGNCAVELFEATEELPFKLAENKVDIVFNIAEGTAGRGREAQIPAILNIYKIPFTGSDETTLCIALDKALTKRILTSYHIRTPKYKIVRRDARKVSGPAAYPAIVKPNAEGSSKGISSLSYVSNAGELQELVSKNIGIYGQDMLVEEYIAGREFTVGLLGNGKELRVFPPMEIIYKNPVSNVNIYSYEVKRDFKTHIRYECPAQLPPETMAELMNTAKKIFGILGCMDFARIDFRLAPDGRIYFIEINPLPGLAPGYSDFPMIAQFCGMDYDTLVLSILDCALKRHGLSYRM